MVIARMRGRFLLINQHLQQHRMDRGNLFIREDPGHHLQGECTLWHHIAEWSMVMSRSVELWVTPEEQLPVQSV